MFNAYDGCPHASERWKTSISDSVSFDTKNDIRLYIRLALKLRKNIDLFKISLGNKI